MIVPGKNETPKQYRTFPNRCKFCKIRCFVNVAFQIRGESMGYSINGAGTNSSSFRGKNMELEPYFKSYTKDLSVKNTHIQELGNMYINLSGFGVGSPL